MNKKKNFFRKLDMAYVNLAASVIFCAIAVIACMGKKTLAVTLLCVAAVLTVAANIIVRIMRKKENDSMIADLNYYIGEGERRNSGNLIGSFMQPLLFLDSKGNYIWANDMFRSVFSSEAEMMKYVLKIYRTKLKSRIELRQELIVTDTEINGRFFKMMCNVASQFESAEENAYYVIYFTETTDFETLREQYENERVAVGEIKIDTYEEIFFNDGEIIGNNALAILGNKFEEWLEDKGAMVKRLSRDRFIFITEEKDLKTFEKEGFSILKSAKTISCGNTVPVTLSIGISAYAGSLKKNFEIAESALELALARGGDQAVIRIDGRDTYYGGSNIDISSKNTVKSRVAADKLAGEIKKSSRVIIMGHSNPDMDAIGSALAIYRISCICGVPANIVLNSGNKSIEVIYKKLMAAPEYEDVFVDNTEILARMDDDCLVVVTDTYTQKMTECPKLIDLAKRVAVIDHHRKGADYISNTVFDYSETYASSTSELMTEILQFIDPDIKLPILEAEALYAGILVDTKNFVFKTGIKTFNAAGFLREMGVDFIQVKKYFLPDYETFSNVSKVTSAAKIVSQRVAVSVVDQSIKDGKFVAALAADKLLEISGIGASFVLTEGPGGISISGRSLGEINVQVILEKMGGGGHLTAAGAFVRDGTVEGAIMTLEKNIEEYFKI